MRSWKDYHSLRTSKYRSTPQFPFLSGIMEVREFQNVLTGLAICLDLFLIFVIGYGFMKATIIAWVFHLIVSFTFSTVGTILERAWRRNIKIQEEFIKTLGRLALNKSRKVENERKTSI